MAGIRRDDARVSVQSAGIVRMRRTVPDPVMQRRAWLASIAALPFAARAALASAQDAPGAAPIPARYERLILRFGPGDTLIPSLRYEGNNLGMRGARATEGGTFAADGEAIARRWRAAASRCAGVFALRDTLFSQQDHPFDHAPRALLMPPSWVSVAVDAVRAGCTLVPMRAPDPGDDAAWAALDDAAIHGSFPPSARLAELARTGDPARRANARASLRALAADTAAMIAAAGAGPEAVAEAGALRIAASDRAYFGDARPKASLIFVENPNDHERLDEGKGMVPPDREVDPGSVAIARRAVYAARLGDGDLSLERYDLTLESERARVIALLEELAPRGSRGATIWVWAHAGYDGHSTRGPDPLPHIGRFRRELRTARLARDRVRILARPSLELPRVGDRRAALEAAIDRSAAIDLPLSVHLDTRSFRRLLGP